MACFRRIVVGMLFVLLLGQYCAAAQRNDYDGDGYSDAAVWWPEFGMWYVWTSSNGMPPGGGWSAVLDQNQQPIPGQFYKQWGLSTDIPVPGDYGGDGCTDLGVYRRSNQTWYLSCSDPGTYALQFSSALPDAIPVAATFRNAGLANDVKCDMALYNPGTNRWYVRDSHDLVVETYEGPAPVGAAARDPYVFCTGTESFIGLYQRYLVGGQQRVAWSYLAGNGPISLEEWASHSDVPVSYYPGFTVYFTRWRTDGHWISVNEYDGQVYADVPWGLAGDTPLVGNYDGSGSDDRCVWRPSEGRFYVLTSSGGAPGGTGWNYIALGAYWKSWGLPGFTPVQCNR